MPAPGAAVSPASSTTLRTTPGEPARTLPWCLPPHGSRLESPCERTIDGVPALRDRFAFAHRYLAQVIVRRRDAAAVRNHDHVPGEEAVACQHDRAALIAFIICALARKHIQAEVLAAVSVVERHL